MIKSRMVTKEKEEFFDVCKECGKEIKGTTESMVAFNMGVHKSGKECKK